jgi:hypothetical protein
MTSRERRAAKKRRGECRDCARRVYRRRSAVFCRQHLEAHRLQVAGSYLPQGRRGAPWSTMAHVDGRYLFDGAGM